MKTLDEVIAELEDEGLFADALHYLKAFRYAKDTLELEKDRYREAVRNCEEAELKYRKLAQSLGEVGNTEIPPIMFDMSEEEAEEIRKEIVKNAELRRKLGMTGYDKE